MKGIWIYVRERNIRAPILNQYFGTITHQCNSIHSVYVSQRIYTKVAGKPAVNKQIVFGIQLQNETQFQMK